MKKVKTKKHIFPKIILAIFLTVIFTSVILIADFYIYLCKQTAFPFQQPAV